MPPAPDHAVAGSEVKIQEIEAIEARLGPEDLFPWYGDLDRVDVVVLLAEVRRLRKGLWDCAGISGADLDGDETPDALFYPDIVEYAKREVQQLRNDYDDSLEECCC